MVEVSKELLREIYNELVCCRRFREEQMLYYIATTNDDYEHRQMQIDMFKKSIEDTRGLYEQIKDKIE